MYEISYAIPLKVDQFTPKIDKLLCYPYTKLSNIGTKSFCFTLRLSPIILECWAPTGLKYLRLIIVQSWDFSKAKSLRLLSIAILVAP